MTPQEAWESRGNLYNKYNDPNWLLQAGLGDIEFEQDMYDDIRYGGTSNVNQFLDLSDDPYDVTGLAGLREHATKGPARYLDFTPFDLPSEKFDKDKFGYDVGEGGYENYLGRYNIREDALGKGTGETTNIDLNLPRHINWWDRTGRGGGHALQNMISDTYRHEYKHSPKLTNFRNPYHHQAIYGQGAKYGLSPVTREQSFQRFMNPPAENFPTVHYNPSTAAEASRDISSFARNPFERSFEQPTNRAVSRQPVRGPHDYKKGGSVDPQEGATRGDLKDWFLDMKGRRPFGRTVTPEPRSKRGDWVDWFLNRRGLAGKFGGNERYKYDSYNPYDYQLFQRGGSVNPHEETTRAAREWNTREQPTRPWDGVQPPRPWAEPYRPNPDREWTPPKGEPYEPDLTREPTGAWSLLSKGYEKVKPFIPEYRNDMLNWNLGNWNVGVGQERFNLGLTVPFNQTSALDTGIGGLDEYQMARLNEYPDYYYDYIPGKYGGDAPDVMEIDIDGVGPSEFPDLADWKQGQGVG